MSWQAEFGISLAVGFLFWILLGILGTLGQIRDILNDITILETKEEEKT